MADRLINVFRKSELNDYLESAEKTAGWIKKYEITDERGKRWKISGTEGKDPDAVESSFLTDTSLYGGAAGIGYFYLQLYELTGAEKYLEEAEDAAEYLINTYEKKML